MNSAASEPCTLKLIEGWRRLVGQKSQIQKEEGDGPKKEMVLYSIVFMSNFSV